MKIPMVEIFQTVEGEGLKAGFLTTFVRLYNCNLRCTWCDTKYSYSPAQPEFFATIEEIAKQVQEYGNPSICLTGGEPLMHGEKSVALIERLAQLSHVQDIHVETNGAIDLSPFVELRRNDQHCAAKVRFIMDYKLASSGEKERMILHNFSLLDSQDEIKFVVGNKDEFREAADVLRKHYQQGQILFSPVWGDLPPAELVTLMLASTYKKAKLSLQTHKYIWHPDKKGV
jgi:7-carboxy-7-deazaguanine synthase